MLSLNKELPSDGCHLNTEEWMLVYLKPCQAYLKIFTPKKNPCPGHWVLHFPLMYIASRYQLSARRIKLRIRCWEHNLCASISSHSSTAIAHSIHVGLLPGLFLMQGRDGSSAVIFKGQGAASRGKIKDRNAPYGLTFQSAPMRCETNDLSRL